MTTRHPVRKDASGYRRGAHLGKQNPLDSSYLECGVEPHSSQTTRSCIRLSSVKASLYTFGVHCLWSCRGVVLELCNKDRVRGASIKQESVPPRQESLEERAPRHPIVISKVRIRCKPFLFVKLLVIEKSFGRTPLRQQQRRWKRS